MSLVELSGLVAALCWTITSLMAPKLLIEFGSFRFNTVRISMASITLIAITVLTQTVDATIWRHTNALILSGLVGIFIGDTFLFNAMSRLGPRRTGVLFATNAPMAIIFAWIVFDETLSVIELFGCALVTFGAMIAILYGRRKNQLDNVKAARLEETKGSLAIGVCMALIAAFCQVSGAILSKPALLDGTNPITASAIRVSAAALALIAAYVIYSKRHPIQATKLHLISLSSYLQVFIIAIIGMVIGMSVLVWGIGYGNIGIVTTLSATVPVLVLPAIWIVTGQRPALGAWIGAILVVIGAGLIVLY